MPTFQSTRPTTFRARNSLAPWCGLCFVFLGSTIVAQIEPEAQAAGKRPAFAPPSPQIERIVGAAFNDMHEGWSTDEVLLQDNLRRRFAATCCEDGAVPSTEETDAFCRALIHLRKRGGILAKATRRAPTSELSVSTREQMSIVAEIASRRIHDEFLAHTDAILVDSVVRTRFNRIAEELLARYQISSSGPPPKSDRRLTAESKTESKSESITNSAKATDRDLYLVRKSALRLRKTRRLQPELLSRVTDWKRSIAEFEIAVLSDRLLEIPEKPGIYIFRDGTGFLYIGQAANLRSRLRSHLSDSDRVALADYLAHTEEGRARNNSVSLELHIFEKGSPGESLPIRRAYESELIRTREPRLNIQP
ncbi:MAG: GIY-YIG nuclease family protein [Aureliella sp.]